MTWTFWTSLWTITAALGVLLAGWLVWVAFGDLTALRRAGTNGDQRLLAHRYIRNALVRVFSQLVFAVLGVWSATQPPAPVHVRSAFEWFSLVGIESVEIALVLAAVFDLYDRYRLLFVRESDDG